MTTGEKKKNARNGGNGDGEERREYQHRRGAKATQPYYQITPCSAMNPALRPLPFAIPTDTQNLAISYVNESLDLAALTVLHQLLTTLHPVHAGPAPSRTQMTEVEGPWALHQSMTDQYLNLARGQYLAKGEVDPNVQVGLGTLYYMMGEYGEARGCWVAALGERPDVSVCSWFVVWDGGVEGLLDRVNE